MATKLWEGLSPVTGEPIAVYLTGDKKPSKNSKTGNQAQTWILKKRQAPHRMVAKGHDAAVCGSCPQAGGNGCYVNVARAPLSVWKAGRGSKAETVTTLGVPLRLGAYGDPAMVPLQFWLDLLKVGGHGHTGYSHQWVWCDRGFNRVVMASVESLAGKRKANRMGYRTFRVVRDVADLTADEILCPASAEAGYRTQCAACELCNGSRGRDDKRKNIAIVAHGFRAAKAAAMVVQGGE